MCVVCPHFLTGHFVKVHIISLILLTSVSFRVTKVLFKNKGSVQNANNESMHTLLNEKRGGIFRFLVKRGYKNSRKLPYGLRKRFILPPPIRFRLMLGSIISIFSFTFYCCILLCIYHALIKTYNAGTSADGHSQREN